MRRFMSGHVVANDVGKPTEPESVIRLAAGRPLSRLDSSGLFNVH